LSRFEMKFTLECSVAAFLLRSFSSWKAPIVGRQQWHMNFCRSTHCKQTSPCWS
jgi:hypothetical protein